MLLLCCTLPAAASDYTLGVFGNANEDGTIDLQDVEYTERIVLGLNNQTQLADAEYDDKINILDMTQTELIIFGMEKELTIIDDVERVVTIDMPLERVISIAGSYGPETFCAFGVQDGLVGVADYAKENAPHLNSFLEDIPGVGGSKTPDVEKILELKPQIVHSYACYYQLHSENLEATLNAAGIKLVPIDFHKAKTHHNAVMTMGYLLNRRERANELIDFEDEHLGLIEDRIRGLTDEQKPRVYLESYLDYRTCGSGGYLHDDVLIPCGGINIFEDVTGTIYIDPEAAIEKNPQVIIRTIHEGMVPSGYGVTNTSSMGELRADTMNRPGWNHLDAVKNGRVYLISTAASSTHASVFHSYFAKCLHPELFGDINPEAIHAEWFERYLGIGYDGVWAYPPLESL